MQELINSVLEWWKIHECDTSPDGEYNVYNSEPEFVTKAKKLKEQTNCENCIYYETCNNDKYPCNMCSNCYINKFKAKE